MKQLRGLCLCLALTLSLLTLTTGSSRADGKHGYVFGGWTGKVGYLYTRNEDQADSLGEFRSHLTVSGILTVTSEGKTTITFGWDEIKEDSSDQACIGRDASEGSFVGRALTRTTGKGGLEAKTTLQVSSDAKQLGFHVPGATVRYTEEETFPECPSFEPKSRTWTVEYVGGEVFNAVIRLADPEVPKLKGSIDRARSNPAGTIKEQWRVGFDLASCGEYAGRRWPIHFEDDKRIEALNEPIRSNVKRFVGALEAAGAKVTINTVYRPQPRAYLMHYSWRVGYGRDSKSKKFTHIEPPAVPKYDGPEKIPICWMVPGLDGKYSRNLSIKSAQAMAKAYGIVEGFGAAYPTNHSRRTAIDMNISWRGTLKVKGGPNAPFRGAMVEIPAGGAYWIAGGKVKEVTATSKPPEDAKVRSDQDMNQKLWRLGLSYGVKKLELVSPKAPPDPPHWSQDGR